MQKSFLILVTALFLTSFLDAQIIYYVSSSGGNDSNSGTSSSSPWKTLSKLNSVLFVAGNQILFKKGDVWREQLTILRSGSSSAKIQLSSYGTGNVPVINGSNLVTGFTQHSGNIWKKSITTQPQQIFFNGVRGTLKTSVTSVNSANSWYWSSNYLYIYSNGNPSTVYNAPGIENAVRGLGISVRGDHINISNLQIEKVTDSGIDITSTSFGVVIDNCTFYQWCALGYGWLGAITINGSNSEVKNCTFGKNTGNDIADQGWAGIAGIIVNGNNITLNNNNIYHSAIENESSSGAKGWGIRVSTASGTIKIFDNYIYHVGSHGIVISANTVAGDKIEVYSNIIEYPGLAGITLYQTRGDDGTGGKGYVYNNTVSFANRLGGDVGSGGQQASGIHFNDGVRGGTDPSKPFIKWYCYQNDIHNSGSLADPNSPDGGGISMDYNANNVEVYRNICYNNSGKGIYMWNANNCKVSYNIIYGNDAGITVTALSGGVESCTGNQIYNNTCFKNYNTDARGPNLNTEIFFGFNGKNNIIKNNIFYSAYEGYAYIYNVQNTSGNVLNNNLVFGEKSLVIKDGAYGEQTFAQWRTHYPIWDINSLNANPLFTNASGGDFTLESNSPAINAGAQLGLTLDYLSNPIDSEPDIGALEYISGNGSGTHQIILNAMDGSLSGDARLGYKSGSINSSDVYFVGTTGGDLFSVSIPAAGQWYAWGRIYSQSSGGKNSFSIAINGNSFILGDNDSKYDQWYWDGYQGSRINLGSLIAGTYNFRISGREPGTTLWIDQIVLTNDPNYNPNTAGNETHQIILNAMDGSLSGDARLGYKSGSINSRDAYFVGTTGGDLFSVSIPAAGQWYAWGRIYSQSSGGKNSFLVAINGNSFILGDNDSKYDQWYWDGYQGSGINLGSLIAGTYNFRISGREPGTTLWIDQIVLTDDPNYNPNNALAKTDTTSPELVKAEILNDYTLSQNYPNPFNPTTIISYTIPSVTLSGVEGPHVTLKVFDMLGNEVATLVNRAVEPGNHTVLFDATGRASGVYVYRIESLDFVETKKMILLK